MRYLPAESENMMDYLFLWGKANGYSRFNMGMAPLAGMENRNLALPIRANRSSRFESIERSRIYHSLI